MDIIYIRDLTLECIVGVYEYERKAKRPLTLNIELEADLSPGTLNDRIEDTLSYEGVYNEVCALVENSECQLIEALAEAVAVVCLRFVRVQSVTIQIDKPDVFPKAAACGVCITREK